MNAQDFVQHVESADRNQRLMARVYLNRSGYASDYPVDISELRTLSPMNRAVTNAFLEWVRSHRLYALSETYTNRIKALLVLSEGEA